MTDPGSDRRLDGRVRDDPPEPEALSVADWTVDWVLVYVHQPNLWPVAVAILGHVVLVLTGLELIGWRTGSPLPWIALVALGALSAWLGALEIRTYGRPGGAWVALALTWLTSGALSWFSERTGIL